FGTGDSHLSFSLLRPDSGGDWASGEIRIFPKEVQLGEMGLGVGSLVDPRFAFGASPNDELGPGPLSESRGDEGRRYRPPMDGGRKDADLAGPETTLLGGSLDLGGR